MIVDTFMFFNEFDILNLRLEELYDIVDEFIAVETDLTHNGKPKPYYLSENLDKVDPKYRGKLKIHRIKHTNRDPLQNAWVRENEHRKAILTAVDKYPDTAQILISDCDEIPSAAFIEMSAEHPVCVSMQKFFYYTFDTHKIAHCHGTISVFNKKTLYQYNPQLLRDVRFKLPRVRGGWHLSYFGGAEKVVDKISSFAHTEFNTNNNTNPQTIQNRIDRKQDVFGRNTDFESLTENADYSDLPKAFLNNPEKYKSFINDTKKVS